jgi:hypothetical protein
MKRFYQRNTIDLLFPAETEESVETLPLIVIIGPLAISPRLAVIGQYASHVPVEVMDKH